MKGYVQNIEDITVKNEDFRAFIQAIVRGHYPV